MIKKILLTGATGFVGKQILNSLSRYDVNIYAVVHEKKRDQLDQNNQVKSIITTKDLFNEKESWWIKVCKDIDTVLHVAWYVEPGKYLQSPLNLNCLNGTLELARACVKTGIKRYVGIGTCFEYDLSASYLSIDTPLKPTTPYAAAKAATFLSLSHYFSKTDINFLWCRLFYLFGEGENKKRLIPYLRNKLEKGEIAELTSGLQIRDFMDVKNAAKKIVKATFSNTQGAFNVCSGKGITVKELAEKIADEYGRRDLLKFGVRKDNLADPPCVVGVRSNMKF